MPKFKVIRRLKGLVDGDATKGKAPSVNEPGDIVTVESGERTDALVKAGVLAPVDPKDADSKSKGKGNDNGKAKGNGNSNDQQQQKPPTPGKLDPAALPNMSVEDLRKIATDEFEFAPASVAKLSKDELLALLAEAIAKEEKA